MVGPDERTDEWTDGRTRTIGRTGRTDGRGPDERTDTDDRKEDGRTDEWADERAAAPGGNSGTPPVQEPHVFKGRVKQECPGMPQFG